jgi:parvulin-like peptidyl-prolyl isomerase
MKANIPEVNSVKTVKHMIMAAAIGAALFSAGQLSAAVVNRTVAKINDDVILQSDFDAVCKPFVEQMTAAYGQSMPAGELQTKLIEVKKKLLDKMIDQKLLLQEAKKKKLTASGKEIDDGIATIKERFKTSRDGKEPLSAEDAEAAFNDEMKKQNLTIAKFKDQIKEELMVNKLIDSEVVANVKQPTEQEISDYYKKNSDKLIEPEKVSVRHILIRVAPDASIKDKSQAMNKIKEVEKKLKKGGDFAKLAEQYSEDPGSAKNGGDLGPIEKGVMLKSFEDVAFKTPVGKTSAIFETDFGYHIIKVDSKKAEQKKSLAEIKDSLIKYMTLERQQQEYDKYVKSLRDKAEISFTNTAK